MVNYILNLYINGMICKKKGAIWAPCITSCVFITIHFPVM